MIQLCSATRSTFFVASVFAGAACSSSAKPSATTVVFGALIDQSGSLAAPSRIPAVQLAVRDANAGLRSSKSFASFSFSAAIDDTGNTPSTAVHEAVAAVDDAGAKFLLVDSSQDVTAVYGLTYQPDAGSPLKVPLIGVETTSAFLCDPQATLADAAGNPFTLLTYQNSQGWMFRTTANSNGEAVALLQVAHGYGDAGDVDGDGRFTTSILVTNEPFGLGFWASLQAAAVQVAPWGTNLDGGAADLRIFLLDPTLSANNVPYAALLGEMASSSAPDAGPSGPPDFLTEGVFAGELPGLIEAYNAFYAGASARPRFLHTHGFHFSSVLQVLGTQANGQEGISFVVTDPLTKASSYFLTALPAFNGGQAPLMWDAQSYDAANLGMLATLYAAHANGDDNPAKVTGDQVRQALAHVNDASGSLIGGGAAEFQRAADLIASGAAVNYDGASGPCDFDANGNIQDRVTHFVVSNSQFQDGQVYDCVKDPATCPPVTP